MNKTSIFLTNVAIHPSWKPFFDREDIQEELLNIEQKISGKSFTPKTEHVLRFATTDLQTMEVSVLGLDPYPTMRDNGQLFATGRAFEVQGATSWFDKEVSPSLKNIVKLIHKSYFDHKTGASIEQVRQDVESGVFPIPTPDKAFSYWEEQGVLWLNTAFTCEVGGRPQSKSHLKHWNRFFKELLQYMAKENPRIKYFLWGGDASKYVKQLVQYDISTECFYESKHPCTNGDAGGYKKKSYFLMNPCFDDTKSIIKWTL